MRRYPTHRFLFYANDLERGFGSIELEGDEHHHMSRVLRMPVGGTAYVTNGRGLIATCRIAAVGRRACRLSVEGVEDRGDLGRAVTLALALLKKEAFERAVEQCTELGMTKCIPFVSERSHLKRYSLSFTDRLRRIALSAMKQSFRSWLPEIDAIIAFEELLARVGEAGSVIVGDADAEPLGVVVPEGPLMIVVGPEGGLTNEECSALVGSGALAVSVSPYRLRSETAAASLVALACPSRPPGRAGGPDSIDRSPDHPLD